ncbi:unnamed protein product [Acanthoscelides obtectus]|uniref:Uncharacterized protein n=1 Tax=Acanthoscelides obtectus TaxID=200917 RepID=A0A9P0KIK9_ACAOB|nr:unnamed protein product [Acanthoscelides obtectus]CAK1655820.1 hypothetical protein AOBTE_LOCUS19363 [Acanthoscelides obtectus]
MLKSEYLVAGDTGIDLNLDTGTVKNCKKFRHLEVTISDNGKSDEDIRNKILRGKRVIEQLSPVL